MTRSGHDGSEVETTVCHYYCSHEQSFAQIPYEWLGPAGRLLRDDPLYAAKSDHLSDIAVFSVISGDVTGESPVVNFQPPLMVGIETRSADSGND